MGEKPEITSMKYSILPDRKTARRLLCVIAKRPISFTARKVDKQLILYGASNFGKLAKEYLERLGIPFLCVVDKYPDLYRKDPFWAGVDIFGIQDVPLHIRESALLAICVALAPFSQVTAPLKEQGWRDVVPFYDISEAYRDRHPLSNGWYSGTLNEEDISHIESVLSRWDDDVSRAHHLQFIAWHTLREEWFFDNAPVTTRDRYFIPQVLRALHDNEVFVDIGAHHGEVIIRFLEAVKNRYKEVYAIEPDGENFSKLRNCLEKSIPGEKGEIHLLECALGSAADAKRFCYGLGYASQFSELGHTDVRVKTLDDLLIPATFIKMHIEGWERIAFKGGLKTITINRPILTATAYHNRDGLWKLPDEIMSHLDNYIYYFRVHSWLGTGAVIYAIPRERFDP